MLMRLGIDHRRFELLSPASSQESVSDNQSLFVEQGDGDLETYHPDNDIEISIDIPDETFGEPEAKRQKIDTTSNDNDKSTDSVLEEADKGEDQVLKALSSVSVKLREHLRTNFCPFCNIKVGYDNLSRHIKEIHKKREYKCNLCKKAFKRIQYLNKHKCPR